MYSTLIDTTTLRSLMDDAARNTGQASLAIVDCRFSLADTPLGRQRYAQGHIPGAHYAHLDDDLSGTLVPGVTGRHPLPEREALAARFRDWGISTTTQIVCYDDNIGAIASRLWWLSRWLGHAGCAVLDGGMAAWLQAGGPTDKAVHEPVQVPPVSAARQGDFSPSAPLVDTVDIDTVAGDSVLLADAREADRYAGRVEPIDAVAGHIPGAVNLPFAGNVEADGRFLSPELLRARFAPLLDQSNGRQLVHYCGSGVTAAHNLLAMAHAGLPVAALYPGSYSEWVSRDDERYPVAVQVD